MQQESTQSAELPPIYNAIGVGYTAKRQEDPRIGKCIDDALKDAETVLNVGAGAGGYEPPHRRVMALDPSEVMIRQRRSDAPFCVVGCAEAIPFVERAFDASMAILTMHHWRDWRKGLHEMLRVSRLRVVLLTCDIDVCNQFWFVRDYLPEVGEFDASRFPSMYELKMELPSSRIAPVPIPCDCIDGFFCAYWKRPEAYLDPEVRQAISDFHLLPRPVIDRALRALKRDLANGVWQKRYAHLAGLNALDCGYRLLVVESTCVSQHSVQPLGA